MSAGVILINPKFPRNVGNALRACSNFRAKALSWTPERVDHPDNWPHGSRLPREERMKLYSEVAVNCFWRSNIITVAEERMGLTPVAVEVRPNAERLPEFEHPRDAVYVFGPEDGSLDRGILGVCHRFVVIPATSCLNLAAAVNIVLYDRMVKMNAAGLHPHNEFPIPHSSPVYAGVEG